MNSIIMTALIISATVTLNSQLTFGLPVRDEACQEAADIVFVVDSSSSIYRRDFDVHMKQFINDVVASFKVGPGAKDSRVGMVSFGNRAYLQFYLSSYQTAAEVQTAVNRTRYRGGETYTHKALAFASRVVFSKQHGGRGGRTKKGGVAQVMIVLTDGKSMDGKKTVMQADKLKSEGVTIFAIGVGSKIDEAELTAMSSGDQYTFKVKEFAALDSIKRRVSQSTCNVLKEPQSLRMTTTEATVTLTRTATTATATQATTLKTTETNTPSGTTAPASTSSNSRTEEIPQNDAAVTSACGGKPADIYFLLDASSSVYIVHFHDQVLGFVRDLVSNFRISPLHTRVGVVTFSNDVDHAFGLSTYSDLQSLKQAIHPDTVDYLTGGTNTGDAIKYVTDKFSSEEARRGVAQIIITVTDGLSQSPTKTAQAAAEAREKGIYMFAVGVGKYVDDQELMDISSNPDEDFVFSVENFQALDSITELMSTKTCKAVAKKSDINNDQFAPHNQLATSNEPTSIMFAYTYRNSLSTDIDVIEKVITEFTSDLQAMASRVSVGVVSQPCVSGSLSLMAAGRFLRKISAARSDQNIGLAGLVRKLRTEVFSEVPLTENRVAVLFVDEHTQNLKLLEAEIRKLKFKNVKVVAIAVGDVKGDVLKSLQSLHSSGNLIGVDSYATLQNQKLPLFNLIFSTPEYSGSFSSHQFNLPLGQQPNSWSTSFLSRANSLNSNPKPKSSKLNQRAQISINGYTDLKYVSGKSLVNRILKSTSVSPKIVKKNYLVLRSSKRRADIMPSLHTRAATTRRVTLPPMPLL